MFRRLSAIVLALFSVPTRAAGDEVDPVPARALIGHPYLGESTPSRMRFINVRERPVKILWISFDGTERLYATLTEGQEIIQPTFVAHRWLARDSGDGTALQAFISTRSATLDFGTSQIAIIR